MYIIDTFKNGSKVNSYSFRNFQSFVSQGRLFKTLMKSRNDFDRVEGYYRSTCGSEVISSEFTFSK